MSEKRTMENLRKENASGKNVITRRSVRMVRSHPGPKTVKLFERGQQCFSWPDEFVNKLMISRASGAVIEDVDGNSYLDFSESVSSVGHCNPYVVDAVKDQVERFIHTSGSVGHTEPFLELAEQLKKILPMRAEDSRIAYTTSGTEACDFAMRISRRYTRRPIILAYHDAYHGMTGSTVTISGSATSRLDGVSTISETAYIPYPNCYRCMFGQNYPECEITCLNYMETVMETVARPESIAAVFFEPIQVHGGIIIPPPDYFRKLEKICKENGIMLVDDEVFTGFGKTGRFFAIEHWKITPDIVCMGKAMGAGLPMGAIACRENYMKTGPGRGGRFGSFGGNPIAAVASMAGIRAIKDQKMLSNANRVGEYMMKALSDMQSDFGYFGDIRGKGLLIGVELVEDEKKTPSVKKAQRLVKRAIERGLIISRAGRHHNVVKLNPPLMVTMEQAAEAIEILRAAAKDP